MASFFIHVVGRFEPIRVDMPHEDIAAFASEASRAKFLIGDMMTADEDGVFRRVMISTNRIECVVEG